MSRCRSCKARIEWARSESSGKWMPMEPMPGGAFELEDVNGETYAVWVGEGEGDHESHFSTCPDADDWRQE